MTLPVSYFTRTFGKYIKPAAQHMYHAERERFVGGNVRPHVVRLSFSGKIIRLTYIFFIGAPYNNKRKYRRRWRNAETALSKGGGCENYAERMRR